MRIKISELEKIPRRINGHENPEYNRLYMRIYIMLLKKWAVEKLGRKCSECGLVSEYDCIYDFHHEDQSKTWSREENPSNMAKKELLKWKKADKIPEDVKLLCSNCHRIKHIQNDVKEFREKFELLTNSLNLKT